jgi:outer membrane biosynthesis protein TonB
MSFKDGEMHTLAAVGAFVLSVALGAGLYGFSDEAKADPSAPSLQDLDDLKAIEASIAKYTKPKPKLPEKKFREPDPEPEADKVSRTADKMTDPPKDKPKDPKIDPNDPLKNVKRRDVDDDEPIGKKTEEAGSFNESEHGFDEETKGDPFVGRVKRDIQGAWALPGIVSASNPAVACLHITADGKIAKTKLKSGSGDSQFDQSLEQALKQVETQRNNNPEPIPPSSIRLVTTQWICFKFNPQSRAD